MKKRLLDNNSFRVAQYFTSELTFELREVHTYSPIFLLKPSYNLQGNGLTSKTSQESRDDSGN